MNNASKIPPSGPPRCSSQWCLSPGVTTSDLESFLRKSFKIKCRIPNFARWNTVGIFTWYYVSLAAFGILVPLVRACNLTYWPGEQSTDSYSGGEAILVARGKRAKKVIEFCRSAVTHHQGIICSAPAIPRWHLIKLSTRKMLPLRVNWLARRASKVFGR